jgi:hypothetical protein
LIAADGTPVPGGGGTPGTGSSGGTRTPADCPP